jgi:hypothetical protein
MKLWPVWSQCPERVGQLMLPSELDGMVKSFAGVIVAWSIRQQPLGVKSKPVVCCDVVVGQFIILLLVFRDQ